MNLDPNKIETFSHAYHSKNHIYIANKYVHQGKSDLYQLINLRSQFSASEIAQIASQIIQQIEHLHEHEIVYKYLSPKHVIVNHGLHIDQSSIDIQVTDVAVMQLIDVPEKLKMYEEKICGINRLFCAPEVQENSQNCTEKADVWSLGVILYFLVTGASEIRLKCNSNKRQVFNFLEPAWKNTHKEVLEFVQKCLHIDLKKRMSMKQLVKLPLVHKVRQQSLDDSYQTNSQEEDDFSNMAASD